MAPTEKTKKLRKKGKVAKPEKTTKSTSEAVDKKKLLVSDEVENPWAEDGGATPKNEEDGAKDKHEEEQEEEEEDGEGNEFEDDVRGFFLGLDPVKAARLRVNRTVEFVDESSSEDEEEEEGEGKEDGKATKKREKESDEGSEEDEPSGKRAKHEDQGSDDEAAQPDDGDVPINRAPETMSQGTAATTSKPLDPNTRVKWAYLRLGKPLMRVIDQVGFYTPTPIQARVIRPILDGMDVCARAVTGSGKTAAFVLPMLEKLAPPPGPLVPTTQQPKGTPTYASMRGLILEPTREIALQCQAVIQQLAVFTRVTCKVVCGGTPQDEQIRELKLSPTIVVATPGRLIDLLRNAPGVTLDGLEMLVLDEADRLLSMGFREDIKEILRFCPQKRQTLQFSATMTRDVDQLAGLALTKPLNVDIGPLATSALLQQEFVRVTEEDRKRKPAMLAALCQSTYPSGVICFVGTRQAAHFLHSTWKLLGLKSVELHGRMRQEERVASLEAFRAEESPILFCTDVAARGLDIIGVRCVINYDMPPNIKGYIHRVGRTARMGAKGVALSFCSDGNEDDRLLMLQIVKLARMNNAAMHRQRSTAADGASSSSSAQQGTVKKRTIPPEEIDQWYEKYKGVRAKLADTLKNEGTEQTINNLEVKVTRAANIIKFYDEILKRPQKTWHLSETQKQLLAKNEKNQKVAENRHERRKELREANAKKMEKLTGQAKADKAMTAAEWTPEEPKQRKKPIFPATDINYRPIKVPMFSKRKRIEAEKEQKKDALAKIRPARILEKMTSMERKLKKKQERKMAVETRSKVFEKLAARGGPKKTTRTIRLKGGRKRTVQIKSHDRAEKSARKRQGMQNTRGSFKSKRRYQRRTKSRRH